MYADGLRIARVNNAQGSNPTITYYHTDMLGSTRLVTSSTKTVLFSDGYQPYGQDNSATGSETYKFTGKPVSQTTGLYYYYHRWYDPAIGRFMSRDPKPGTPSNPQTLNPYVYVLNCPCTHKDPSGEGGQVIPRGGAVIWFDDGSVTILSNQNDLILTIADRALHGIRPIQIDRSQAGPNTSTITYSDSSVSVVNENDQILSIASMALHGVRPVSIQATSGFSPFSVNNPSPNTNDWLNNAINGLGQLVNQLPPCLQIVLGVVVLVGIYGSLVAIGIPTGGLATIASVLILGDEIVWGTVIGAGLISLGLSRMDVLNPPPCWNN